MKAIAHADLKFIEIHECEWAVPNDDEVLVSVHSAGLGSDAHAYAYEDDRTTYHGRRIGKELSRRAPSIDVSQ